MMATWPPPGSLPRAVFDTGREGNAVIHAYTGSAVRAAE
jgi:hypothetical protein